MKNFKELLVWKKGMEIAIQSYKLVSSFPIEERFGLSSQITRAAFSISTNIAEGSSRTSTKDYIRFVEYSLGSCYELETFLAISEAIGYGNSKIRAEILDDIVQEQKMLVGFLNKLRTR